MRPAHVRLTLCCWLTALLLAGHSRPVAAGTEAAELALADRVRQEAGASLDRADSAMALARQWQAERGRARLRLEEWQEAAAVELARRRRELAAGFVSLAPLAHRDGRARLLLAGLAQSAAVAAARVDRLAAEGAALARLQRAAHAATALWTARRTAAVGRMDAAGMRWRRALRRYAASADSFSSGSKKTELGSGRLTSVDRVTLALGSMPAWAPPMRAAADHKHAIRVDMQLDRRLLRVVSSPPMVRSTVRRQDAVAALTRPVLPIAGTLLSDGSAGIAIVSGVDQVVSSPVTGRVMFAEPFRGLGPLLIIDRGGGYHVVLFGLTRLDVHRGASLVAGQSVGEIVAPEDGPARLHFELRYRGLPIDPAPWLAAYQDKVRS